MRAYWMLLATALATLAGCNQATAPRDLTPPAAPRGVRSITGDHTVYLSWLANTERDVAGYHVYQAPCANGPDCPYTLIGTTTASSVPVTGLANGVTAYYAVAAFDYAGNESELSYEDIFDTPRPEGFGAQLSDYQTHPQFSGWDFSDVQVRAFDDPRSDLVYSYNGSFFEMLVPANADIQDAGYATTLDAVDFAPDAGWSPTGSVEIIPGHCYVVWTGDNYFAKFRVVRFVSTGNGPPNVEFDWAYQVARGNPELKARPARARAAVGAVGAVQ
jgi:hypothetical protein